VVAEFKGGCGSAEFVGWCLGIVIKAQNDWRRGATSDRFQVTMHRSCHESFLVGTILMQHRDLTAKNWLVLTGAHDLLALEPYRVAHTVAKVFLHPDFNLDTFDSDVALLRLNSPVSWSSTVSPVCLPPPDYEFHSATQCVITGWGVAGL